MANKLSFTVAISVLFDNLNKIANSVKTVFKGMQTDIGNFVNTLWGMVREWDAAGMEMLTKKKANEAQLTAATAQRVAAEKALENARLLHSIATGERKLKAAEQVAYREVLLAKSVVSEEKAVLAVQASNSAARVNMGTRAANTLKVGAGKLMLSLKAMWASFAPGLIISGIMTVISYFKDLYNESKRIKNIFSDYKKEIDKTSTSVEGVKLQSLLNVANNLKSTDKERNGAWKELAIQMDIVRQKGETELEYQQRINNAVKNRQELFKEEARIQSLAQKKAETTDELQNLRKKLNFQGVSEGGFEYTISRPTNKGRMQQYEDYRKINKIDYVEGADVILEEMHNLWKILEDVSNKLDVANKKAISLQPQKDINNTSDIYYDGNRIQEAENSYAKALEEHTNKIQSNELSSRDDELQKIQDNYNTDLSKLDNQLAAGSLSQKKYNEELQNLINNTISLAASLLGGDAIANEFFSNLLAQRMDISLPERQKRDTTFDYRKSNLDIHKEELDIVEKYLGDFKSAIDEGANYMQEELNTAIGKVSSLKDAIQIAEVKEDIKNLQNQLGEGFYSGMKSVVADSDRIVSSFSTMREVLSNVDSSGWERIMAVWNAFTSSMDAYFSIIKLVEQLTEVSERLSRAKQTEAAIDSQVTNQMVANASVEMATDLTAAGVKKATATQELAADTAAAAGAAGKSAAGLPFPFNLIAIAAAIGGVIALFASIPKFAYGGIVGGHSFTGDNILARLNSGEMVLNQGQQSKLFGMLNSGEKKTSGTLVGEKVEFKIEGTTLLGVLNNTNKKLSKYK